MTTQSDTTDTRDAETRRKQRVFLLIHEIADLLPGHARAFGELEELGVDVPEAVDLVIRQLALPVQERFRAFDRHAPVTFPVVAGGFAAWLKGSEMPDKYRAAIEKAFPGAFSNKEDEDEDPEPELPPFVEVGRTADTMRLTIERLFADSGTPEGQTPAISVVVQLRSTSTPFQGALSQTEDGMLRMLVPSQVPGPGGRPQHALMEVFFDVADVVWVSIQRDITSKLNDLAKTTPADFTQ